MAQTWRRIGLVVGASAVAAVCCGCAGETPTVSGTPNSRSQFVRPATDAPTGTSNPFFTKPLRTVYCVYAPASGGVVYLSEAVSTDADGVCDGRSMLSAAAFNALNLVTRCQKTSSGSGDLAGSEGYFVSVHSDSQPANVRAAEGLCA